MKTKVYISGKISGLPQNEYETQFGLAEANLLDMGFEAVNPLKVVPCITEDCNPTVGAKDDGTYLHSWSCYMKHDIIAMLECQAIALLPNWATSRGAITEKKVAELCGLRIFHFAHDLRKLH